MDNIGNQAATEEGAKAQREQESSQFRKAGKNEHPLQQGTEINPCSMELLSEPTTDGNIGQR